MSEHWDAGTRELGGRRRRRERDDQGALVFGFLLIVAGAIFLAAQVYNFDLGRSGWPLYVIVPGLVLLAVGLSVGHEAGLGAAIPGGIVTAVGLVLAFQNETGAYASWSYAWALVAPGSVGVTLALYGLLHRRLDLLDSGLRTAAVGLGLFVGFGLFFEDVIGVDGARSSTVLSDGLPYLAIVLGALIVVWNLLPHPHPVRPALDGEWRDVDGQARAGAPGGGPGAGGTRPPQPGA